MVTERPEGSNAGRDRAQLILIGALALAFILLGIVVVYNGVLFTETISSSSTGQSASHAELADEEVERGVQWVIQRENLEDPEDLDFDEAIGNFDSGYVNTTTGSRPASADVSFEATETNASVETGDLEGVEVVGEPENESIGHFVMNVDTDLDESVAVQNESGDDITSIDPNGDWTLEDRNGEMCEITPHGDQDTVRIDLLTPAVNASNDCETPFITRDDEFENLTIDGNVSGSYELVYKDGDGDGAWTVTVTYTYESSDVSVEKEREIDVYGDRP